MPRGPFRKTPLMATKHSAAGGRGQSCSVGDSGIARPHHVLFPHVSTILFPGDRELGLCGLGDFFPCQSSTSPSPHWQRQSNALKRHLDPPILTHLVAPDPPPNLDGPLHLSRRPTGSHVRVGPEPDHQDLSQDKKFHLVLCVFEEYAQPHSPQPPSPSSSAPATQGMFWSDPYCQGPLPGPGHGPRSLRWL